MRADYEELQLELRRRLRTEAMAVEPSPAPVEATVRFGRARLRRSRAVATAAAGSVTALVVGAVSAGLAARHDGAPVTPANGDSPTSQPAIPDRADQPEPAPPSRILSTQLTQSLLDRCVQDSQGWTRPSPYTGFEVQSPTTNRWEYIVLGRFVAGPLTGGYLTCRGVDRGVATTSLAFGHEDVKDRPYLRAVVEGKGGGVSVGYEEGATMGTAWHSLQGVAAAEVATVTVDFLNDDTGERTTVLHDGVWFLPDVSVPTAVRDSRELSEDPAGTIQIRGHTMCVIRGYDHAGNLIYDSRTPRGSSPDRYPWP
jgi:hypothetical protein